MAHILYLGPDDSGSTSAHRAHALTRLGHSVTIHNPFDAITGLLGLAALGPIHYRTGYRLLQHQVEQWLMVVLSSIQPPDVIWVDGGELLGRRCVALLKKVGCPVVLYNVDDPTGKRDGRRFDSLLQAIPLYDLVAVVRRETEQECRALQPKQVIRVLRSYDEVEHQPFAKTEDIPNIFRSEVVFVGTWMRYEKRDEFLLELLARGIPLSIWGDRWTKSPHWQQLQAAYRGGALAGREYVAAIQGSKICLGLLSKGNRDLHTQRSLEVPFAGGLLCAERTVEHQEIYQEGVDAVFWSDAAECATICHQLLADDAHRTRIRLAGMHKVRTLGVGNEAICQRILREINLA